MGDDRLGPIQPMLAGFGATGQNDKGARRDFAGGEDACRHRVGFALAKSRQPVDLCLLQHREHLIAARLKRRMFGLRHDASPRRPSCQTRAISPASDHIWARADRLEPEGSSLWRGPSPRSLRLKRDLLNSPPFRYPFDKLGPSPLPDQLKGNVLRNRANPVDRRVVIVVQTVPLAATERSACGA